MNKKSIQIITRNGNLLALLGIWVVLSFISDHFLTMKNLLNIPVQFVNIAIMAIGMTFVLILGEIDLSAAAIQSFSGCLVAVLMVNYGLHPVISIILTLIAAALIGTINGFFVNKLKFPAFISTLAMTSIAQGATLLITDRKTIHGLPEGFSTMGQGSIGIIPIPVIIILALYALSHIILTRTKFGFDVYAVGDSMEAAQLIGLSAGRIKNIVLMISGLCAGVSGILLASRLNSAQPPMGQTALMDVIAAVVIGGTSLLGGQGSISGTLIGVLIIGTIRNGLNILGVPTTWQYIFIGIIVLGAVTVDYIGRRKE